MSNIIDLSTMVKEDLVIKMVNGDVFNIPGQVPVEFVLGVYDLQEKLSEESDPREQLNILQKLVQLTLQLDKDKKVPIKYVQDNVSDIQMLQAIMEGIMKHIANLVNDENL